MNQRLGRSGVFLKMKNNKCSMLNYPMNKRQPAMKIEDLSLVIAARAQVYLSSFSATTSAVGPALCREVRPYFDARPTKTRVAPRAHTIEAPVGRSCL